MATFNFNMLVFLAMVVASMAFHGSAKPSNHVVGDADGWSNPRYPLFYNEWVTLQTFAVGDTLYFDFLNQNHDVAEVSQDAYHECNATGANIIIKDGPGGTVELAQGNHYYISTVHDDCKLHQKLGIYVPTATI